MNAEDIFLATIEKQTPAERAAFLESACGLDAQLRAQVMGLLKSHDEAGSFLDGELFDNTPTTARPLAERPGTQIGPYKLLQQIGEGGMGTVYMAEQTEPVKRKVALKVIKAGMDSRQVIARFEAERQALAMMDHVNIARVLDAGTIPLRNADFGLRSEETPSTANPQSTIPNRRAGPTSSWSWSTACRSPSTATTTT